MFLLFLARGYFQVPCCFRGVYWMLLTLMHFLPIQLAWRWSIFKSENRLNTKTKCQPRNEAILPGEASEKQQKNLLGLCSRSKRSISSCGNRKIHSWKKIVKMERWFSFSIGWLRSGFGFQAWRKAIYEGKTCKIVHFHHQSINFLNIRISWEQSIGWTNHPEKHTTVSEFPRFICETQ